MADAYMEFYQGAREGRIRHDGDPVLAEHVAATAAKQTPRGWKISKIDQSKRIDACVATVMAHWRAWRSVAEGGDEGFLL
jgi:phage terminase large subunit-like protein